MRILIQFWMHQNLITLPLILLLPLLPVGFARTPTIIRIPLTQIQKQVIIKFFEEGRQKKRTKSNQQRHPKKWNPIVILLKLLKFKRFGLDTKKDTNRKTTESQESSNPSEDQQFDTDPTSKKPCCKKCKSPMKGHPKNQCPSK